MKSLRIKPSLLTALFFAILLPICAHAAGSATIIASGNRAQVDWNNGMVRIDPANSADHVILRDDHVYSITTANGEARVTDMTGMAQVLRRMIQNNSRASIPFDATIDTVKATDAHKTVAGISGRVYRVTLTDANGRTETQRVVLTDNPQIVAMTRAWLQALPPVLGAAQVAQLAQALPDNDRGLLQIGDDYRLTAVSNTAPRASRFKLPDQSASLSDMVRSLIQQHTRD